MNRNCLFLFALLPLTATAVAPCPDSAAGTSIPAISLQEVASGLQLPVHIAPAGDGSGRLFVVEQGGVIRVLENGRLRARPFLDISERVDSGGERGLLAVVFHPRFRENGLFYVNYTARPAGKLITRVSRFTAADRQHGDPQHETVLLTFEQPYSNHNGGQLAFGPDGFLYIAVGDGGSANDPQNAGQSLGTVLGKILRIDVNPTSGERPYAIPRDNPFVKRAGARPEIWAYGLRNPWRFSFDAGGDRLYAADVGQNAVEEINVIERGGNYGWRIMEGDLCTPAFGKNCNRRGLVEPIHTYRHSEGRSITGGFVYRGAAIPQLCGVYLFADYVSQRVWGLRYDGKRVTRHRELIGPAFVERVLGRLRLGALQISSFGQGEDLELYVAAHQSGRIFRIAHE